MAGVFNASRLAGLTVLVTGASGGIGRETAILFARAGANLIITARRQPQLDEVSAAAKTANKEGGTGKGGNVQTLVLDMQDRTAVAGVMDRLNGAKIDVLVNNAGLVHGTEKVGEIKQSDIETMFNTNVLGLIQLTQLVVAQFKKQNSGHVINIGSVAGREAYAGGAIYCATKAALRSFSGSLLRELVATKIRVTEIQPGMVETEFSVTRFRGDQAAADKVYAGVQPLVALDIAEEIVWAASRPTHVNLAEVYILPSCQAGPGIVARQE